MALYKSIWHSNVDKEDRSLEHVESVEGRRWYTLVNGRRVEQNIARGWEGGGPLRPDWKIQNFRNGEDECTLQDLDYTGYRFTWYNGQRGELI